MRPGRGPGAPMIRKLESQRSGKVGGHKDGTDSDPADAGIHEAYQYVFFHFEMISKTKMAAE